jgi:hypothetical protein
VLRKDLPIATKDALNKSDKTGLECEMSEFLKSIPSVEKKLTAHNDENLPPVRSTASQTLKISASKTDTASAAQQSAPSSNVSFHK